MLRRFTLLGLLAVVCWISTEALTGQDRNASRPPTPANGDWPHYTSDLSGTRYSPLAQIDANNFNKLEIAWRFKTDSLGPRPEFNLESTPLMVNGRLFSTGGTRRAVVALDAATGEMLWMHS